MKKIEKKDEKDVISLPISSTYELTTKYKIHACPDQGRPYSTYERTKYITFRKSKGIMEYLYTTQFIIRLYPKVKEDEINLQLSSLKELSQTAKNRLKGYIISRLTLPKKKMAFTLNKDGSNKLYRFYIFAENQVIPLPHKPRLLKTRSAKYYSLSQILGSHKHTNDVSGLEGRLEEAKYLRRTRNREIVDRRKIKDDYTCQACRFRFENEGKFIIDCHHKNPLSIMQSERIIKIKDLICLCPNCHRIAHSRKIPYEVEEIKALLSIALKKIFS